MDWVYVEYFQHLNLNENQLVGLSMQTMIWKRIASLKKSHRQKSAISLKEYYIACRKHPTRVLDIAIAYMLFYSSSNLSVYVLHYIPNTAYPHHTTTLNPQNNTLFFFESPHLNNDLNQPKSSKSNSSRGIG